MKVEEIGKGVSLIIGILPMNELSWYVGRHTALEDEWGGRIMEARHWTHVKLFLCCQPEQEIYFVKPQARERAGDLPGIGQRC